jgi:hypothetical protein
VAEWAGFTCVCQGLNVVAVSLDSDGWELESGEIFQQGDGLTASSSAGLLDQDLAAARFG